MRSGWSRSEKFSSRSQFADASQVRDEVAIPLLFGAPVRHPKQIRRVDCDEPRAPPEIGPASEPHDWQKFPGECQNRRGAERGHELRVHKSQFLVQPPPVMLDFARCRLPTWPDRGVGPRVQRTACLAGLPGRPVARQRRRWRRRLDPRPAPRASHPAQRASMPRSWR
jgi:hypothetical protein